VRPILVTGSAGFVGRHVTPLLGEAFGGVPVVATARRLREGVQCRAVDLTDPAATDRLVADTRPAMVVHLAAHASVGSARFRPDGVWRDNRNGAYALAAALARHAPDATVLLASTAEVYGRNLRLGPATEETPPAPIGAYAQSKLAAEFIFATVLPPTARLIVARPMNHVGRGQGEAFAVASFAAQIARIEAGLVPPVIRVGNLDVARDFLDVRDVAASYATMLRAAERLPQRAILNVARGEPVTIRTVLDTLLSLSSAQVSVEIDPRRVRPNDIPRATARAYRLKSIMPWPPARTLDETLADVLDDHRIRVATEAGRD
jgi:GDP-4-dehydro-6-deoxy-D-mannose reductase